MRRTLPVLITGALGVAASSHAQPALQWFRVNAPGPSPRTNMAMAYDRARDRVVLNGGFNGQPGGQLDDTWEFDGAAWARIDTPSLGKMYWHGMVYDESRGLCVMATTTAFPRRTCDWDGVKWTEEPIPILPPRAQFALAYNSNHGLMYYHGGFGTLDSGPLSDFWQKKGPEPWVRLAKYTIPEREVHAMAYDLRRDRLVVFGGEGESSPFLGDTWEWDGQQWRQVLTLASPSPRWGMQLTYHEGLGRCVLFGGMAAMGTQGDTWTYDGENWTPVSASGPPPRTFHGMAYDSNRNRAVMYGGFSSVLGFFDDTWALVSTCRANCTGDATLSGSPKLDIQDFTCFQNAFALGDLAKADIAGPLSPCGTPDGTLDIADFTCFQNLFALGCP